MRTPAWACRPDLSAPTPQPPPGYIVDRHDAVANSVLAVGWAPLYLTGFLIDILRRHFGDPLNIQNPDMRNAIWVDDDNPGILIESVGRWRASTVEKRPAVIVKRNAYRKMKVGIGNLQGRDQRGGYNYCKMTVGSHTLFCLNRTEAAAEVLANEVEREVDQFAQVYKLYLNLKAFDVTEVGSVSEIEESTESRGVPVTVGWAYEETWNVAQEGPPLAGIELNLNWLCSR